MHCKITSYYSIQNECTKMPILPLLFLFIFYFYFENPNNFFPLFPSLRNPTEDIAANNGTHLLLSLLYEGPMDFTIEGNKP